MADRLTTLQMTRQLVVDSREQALAAYGAEISRLDNLVLSELVMAGKAYWAQWYGDDYDWSEDSESDPSRKPFETYDQAVDYLRNEIDWDLRIGVEGPPVDLGLGRE